MGLLSLLTGFTLLLLYSLPYVQTGTGDGEEAGLREVEVDGLEVDELLVVEVGAVSVLEDDEAFGNRRVAADHLGPSLSFTGCLRGVGATLSLCLRSARLGSSRDQ